MHDNCQNQKIHITLIHLNLMAFTCIYPEIFELGMFMLDPQIQADNEVMVTVVPKLNDASDRKFQDHRDHGGVWNEAVSWVQNGKMLVLVWVEFFKQTGRDFHC